ncbi:MAG: hypothetical protein IPL39_22255 [Opitutaceae bacterium]|nr:hypothetical protein [Opitutaceae bacterium]
MKTTRMITVLLVSSAILGGLGFALSLFSISLATLINVTVGTVVSAGLFGILLWDTGRTLEADAAKTRYAQRVRRPARPPACTAPRRPALVGC